MSINTITGCFHYFRKNSIMKKKLKCRNRHPFFTCTNFSKTRERNRVGTDFIFFSWKRFFFFFFSCTLSLSFSNTTLIRIWRTVLSKNKKTRAGVLLLIMWFNIAVVMIVLARNVLLIDLSGSSTALTYTVFFMRDYLTQARIYHWAKKA